LVVFKCLSVLVINVFKVWVQAERAGGRQHLKSLFKHPVCQRLAWIPAFLRGLSGLLLRQSPGDARRGLQDAARGGVREICDDAWLHFFITLKN